jgi:hypothetical protein
MKRLGEIYRGLTDTVRDAFPTDTSRRPPCGVPLPCEFLLPISPTGHTSAGGYNVPVLLTEHGRERFGGVYDVAVFAGYQDT